MVQVPKPDFELFKMLRDPSFSKSIQAESLLMDRLSGLDTTLSFIAQGSLRTSHTVKIHERATSIEREVKKFHQRVHL